MKTWRLFGPLILPYWWRITLALLLSVVGSLTDLLRPWPLKIIVDNVVSSKQHHHQQFVESLITALAGHDRTWLLLASVALVFLVAAVGGLCDFAQTLWMSDAGQRVVFALRSALYGHIQRLSLSFHDQQRTGDLVARVTGDVQAIQVMVTTALLSLLSNGLTLAGMVVIMAIMDWQFAILAFSVAPLLFLVVFRYTRRIKQASRLARHKEGEVTAVAQETFAAMRLVQAFTREDYEEERFRRQNEESLSANLETTTLQAQFAPLVDILVALGTCFIIFAGTERVLQGGLTVGGLLVFLSYLGQMYGPMRQLSKLSAVMSRASASAERIAEIMDTAPEIMDQPGAAAVTSVRGRVEFCDVHFAYTHSTPVLRGIDLCVEPGQTIALVGSTGAGKSTVVSLLLRFYDPHEGRILLDGVDLRRLTLRSLRACISIVPQESVLFRTTIRENIAYGRPEATMEEIVAAARAANAHEFIMRLPQGYETVIGERGETLSGGQRQRVAIARAMIRNAPILILDEPTSSLDAAAEALTLEALERLQRGRTTFIIAHRLSTVRAADQIVVLEGGRIVEHGTHEDLVASGGRYRRLLELQFGVVEPLGPSGTGALAYGQMGNVRKKESAKSDMPATLEATITSLTSLGGESAPAEQHSRHRIPRGPVTRVAESALPLFQTCFRSVLTLPQRVPAGVLVVPLALLLFLLKTSTPPSPAQQAATTVIGHITPVQPSPVAPNIQLQPSRVARPQVVERVGYSGNGLGSATYGATTNTSHAPAPTATAPGTIVIHNSPRTAVVGQAERFSVLLPGQPHTWLTYFLHYPDGHEEHIPVRTDGHGYSSHTFRVSPYQAGRFREMGTVGVEDANGRILASTHVAMQQH